MIELTVLKQDGAKADTVTIAEDVFGGKVRSRLLRQVIIMYGANKRVGTAKTKTRSEVDGSSAKLYRQKGTGRARAGNRRSPLRKGGGVIFGPRPRDYRWTMPRKARRLATRNSLLVRLQGGDVIVVDKLEVPEAKTRIVAGILKDIGAERGALVVVAEPDPTVFKAARNIRGTMVLPASDLNAYEVLRARKVVITRPALEKLVEVGQK